MASRYENNEYDIISRTYSNVVLFFTKEGRERYIKDLFEKLEIE